MEEIYINDMLQYIDIVERQYAWLFRGVSKKDHTLIASIAREWNQSLASLVHLEMMMLDRFKTRAISFLDSPPSNDWEWLIWAQHHGMPTRLLDWSENPLVGLYFACEKNFKEDGAVYQLTTNLPILKYEDSTPFGINQDYVIRPPHISPRIAAQKACFTVSGNPIKPLKQTGGFSKLIVKSDTKQNLLNELSRFGIDPSTLFPGLDGLSQRLAMEINIYKVLYNKNPYHANNQKQVPQPKPTPPAKSHPTQPVKPHKMPSQPNNPGMVWPKPSRPGGAMKKKK